MSVSAFAESYGEFKRVAKAIAPSYQAKGILTDGFNVAFSTTEAIYHNR